MSDVFIVLEMPYDVDERPVIHGCFEDCLGALVMFGTVVADLQERVRDLHVSAGYGKEAPFLAYHTGDLAHVEVKGGELDKNTVVIERVKLARRPVES